jgi:Fic family protein
MNRQLFLVLNGDTTATLTIDDTDKPNKVVDIHIQGHDITGTDLRSIRIHELLQQAMPKMKATKPEGRAKLTEDFLREVADIYNTAIDNGLKPVVEVSKAYAISTRTASYWLKHCKKKNLVKKIYPHKGDRGVPIAGDLLHGLLPA